MTINKQIIDKEIEEMLKEILKTSLNRIEEKLSCRDTRFKTIHYIHNDNPQK